MKKNNIKKIKENKNILYKKNKKQKNKIISILGLNAKTKIKTILIIEKKIKKNKKVLIINMDFLEDIFKKEYSKIINNKINFQINGKEFIKLKNKNIYFLDGREIIFKENNFFDFINILTEKFEFIIINTSYECFLNYNKKLIKESSINYFIIDNEDTEYKKCINLLKIYKQEWKVPDEKIEIIINSKKEDFNE